MKTKQTIMVLSIALLGGVLYYSTNNNLGQSVFVGILLSYVPVISLQVKEVNDRLKFLIKMFRRKGWLN